ncbi:transporter substrate-binding domain-containing protein [Oceanispirochaeta crateris]|uniref:Transporter substrate-binding domain-containing protein n=1 Tax=Oceanispirochaeta crateris TaxID=2518645 RepID=A0A5C1QR76_9SPIO|nr:transporter substrate-binding domain-containing protein [Oceanispirochaeta crateris]QEN09480.1 transporter substrate-binding domain-containing protein [Oceanispirochaeta crateris]
MLRKNILLILLAMILSTASVFANGGTEEMSELSRLEEIQESGKLVLATGNYIPFEFLDEETNEMVGYDIDLMRLMADKLGVELEVVDMDFTSLIPSLQAGKADVVCAAMYIKPAREEVVDFATPYMETGMVLVVPSDNETIKSTDDLTGLRVGAKMGATSEAVLQDLLDEGADFEIVSYNETVDYMLDLQTGRIDAAVNDLLNQLEFNKTIDGLKIVGEPFTSAKLGIAVKEGDAELLAFINKNLEEFSADGTMDEIYDRWIIGN